PAGPPLRPGPPLPPSRMVAPSLMPGGIRTFIERVRTSTPAPRHWLQGSSMMAPEPRHWGQGSLNEKNPWLGATEPVPPQVGHDLGRDGGSAPEPPQCEQAAWPRTWRVVVTP